MLGHDVDQQDRNAVEIESDLDRIAGRAGDRRDDGDVAAVLLDAAGVDCCAIK